MQIKRVLGRLIGNQVLSAYSSSVLSVFSALLANFWLFKQLILSMSDEQAGIYGFLFQLAGYLSVLQLGLDFTVSRFIAEAIGRRDISGANESYWNLVKFNQYATLIVALAVIGGGIGLGNGWIHFGKSGDTAFASTVFLLLGTGQVASFLQRPTAAALIGNNQQHIVNLAQVGKSLILTVAGGLALALTEWGVAGVLVIDIGLGLIAWRVMDWIKHQDCKWICSRPTVNTFAKFKVQLKFAAITTIGGIAWTIEATCDSLILGLTGDLTLVGLYLVWWRFPQMGFELVSRLAISAFPSFTIVLVQNYGAAKKTLAKYVYISTGLATLSFLGISLWLPSFIHLWMAGRFAYTDAGLLASLIGFVVYLRVVGNLLGMFTLAANYPSITSRFAWLQAGIKVATASALVFSYGIIGLVIGSIMASTVQVICLSWFLVKKGLLAPFTIVHSSVVALVYFGANFFFTERASVGSVVGLLGGVVATCTLFGLVWLVVLYHSPFQDRLRTLALRIKTAI